MWLISKTDIDLFSLKAVLDKKIAGSRFTVRVEVAFLRGTKRGLKISEVRLRNKKDYCGAHPGPCLVTGKKHIRAAYLEGLDWVGFNALVNDTLDATSTEATVFTYNRESRETRYFVRRGRLRRVRYPYEYAVSGRFAHWTQGGDLAFEDHCGKPPPEIDYSATLNGTPGYPCYTLTEEAKYREQEEAGGAETKQIKGGPWPRSSGCSAVRRSWRCNSATKSSTSFVKKI